MLQRYDAPLRTLAVALLAATALIGSAAAPISAAAAKTLATVNGADITDEDVRIATADLGPTLPQQLQGPQREAYVLDYLIDLKLAAGQAAQQKLGDNPDFAKKMAYYHDKVLMEDLLSTIAKTAVTPDAEKKVYDDAAKAQPARDRDPRPPHPGADRGRGQGGPGPRQERRGLRQGGRRGVEGSRLRRAATSAGSRRTRWCRNLPQRPSRWSRARSPTP